MLKMKLLCVFMLATFLKQSAGADCYTGNAYTKCDDCDSDCFTSNVCICSDNSTCLPSTCDLDPSNCCPVEFSWDSSKACCTVEKTCNRICAADEECIFQDDNKICECNKSMYTNKTKQDLKPVVICDSDIISASVSRCLVQSLGYDYNSFYLNNASSGCVYHYNNITNNQRLDTYQLDAKQGWCGNIVTNDSSKIYVTNTVHFNTTPSLLITKNPIAFNITCGYNKTLQTSLQFALKPLISTAVLKPVNGEGSYTVTMAAFKDSEFNNIIQADDSVEIGSNIFLEMVVTDADGNTFALSAVQCVATPTNNRTDTNAVQLVSEGCASNNGVETEVLENGVSLDVRIRIPSFQFSGFPSVYLFCDVMLCGVNECTGCKVQRSTDGNIETVNLNILLQDNELNSFGSKPAISWATLAGSLLTFLSIKLV